MAANGPSGIHFLSRFGIVVLKIIEQKRNQHFKIKAIAIQTSLKNREWKKRQQTRDFQNHFVCYAWWFESYEPNCRDDSLTTLKFRHEFEWNDEKWVLLKISYHLSSQLSGNFVDNHCKAAHSLASTSTTDSFIWIYCSFPTFSNFKIESNFLFLLFSLQVITPNIFVQEFRNLEKSKS